MTLSRKYQGVESFIQTLHILQPDRNLTCILKKGIGCNLTLIIYSCVLKYQLMHLRISHEHGCKAKSFKVSQLQNIKKYSLDTFLVVVRRIAIFVFPSKWLRPIILLFFPINAASIRIFTQVILLCW